MPAYSAQSRTPPRIGAAFRGGPPLRTIDMKTFVVLTRTRHFGRAAAELNTTQPAVSSRLAALEADFGCRLIERGDGTFRLTEAGEAVLLSFEAALNELDGLAARLHAGPAPAREPLRIGAIDTVASTFMPGLIDSLHQRFPDLKIELTVDGTTPLVAGLREGRFDLIFAIQPLIDDGFRSFTACELQMIWAGSAPLTDPGRVYEPRDLARLPIISFPKGSPPFQMIAPYFHDEQVLASKLTSCNSLYAIVNLMLDAFGVAALPAVTISRELASGRLHALNVSKHFPPMPLVVSYQALTHQDFIRSVVDEARAATAGFCERAAPGTAWIAR